MKALLTLPFSILIAEFFSGFFKQTSPIWASQKALQEIIIESFKKVAKQFLSVSNPRAPKGETPLPK